MHLFLFFFSLPATPVYLQHPTTCLSGPAPARPSLYFRATVTLLSMVMACPHSHVNPDVVALHPAPLQRTLYHIRSQLF